MLFRKRTQQSVPQPAVADPASLVAGGRTVIGRQTQVVGKLSGEGPVTVCGAMKGTIAIRGGLSVPGGGRVEADVQAHSVELAGEAHGRMSAVERVRLAATGEFEGEMDTPILDVTPGSVVRGRARVAGLPVKGRRSSH